MLFFVLLSALVCSVLSIPGLSESLQVEDVFPGISMDIPTSPEPNISGLNTSLRIQTSSSASVESTKENGTTELEMEQNISTSAGENGVSLNISITTTLNDSTPRLADTPFEGSDHEIATSSAIYYFEVLVISLSTIAVVVIAVHLTRQLRLSGFRQRFRSSGRRGTIGKRYSDISLQLLSRESGILDLPNISEERESHVVAGKAEVVHYFSKGGDSPLRSPPLTPTTENGSLKSGDGVWL